MIISTALGKHLEKKEINWESNAIKNRAIWGDNGALELQFIALIEFFYRVPLSQQHLVWVA